MFVGVWRLFEARFFYPRGPDVARLATFTRASADAGWRLFKARLYHPRGQGAFLSYSRGSGADRADRGMSLVWPQFLPGRATPHHLSEALRL